MLELPIDVCAHFSPYLQSYGQSDESKVWVAKLVTEYPSAWVIPDHVTT
jgi:hypothetical protein